MAALLCLPQPAAQAQGMTPSQVVAERVAKITVTPVVADIGVAREITISGTWNGCVPAGARSIYSATPPSLTIVAQLVLPMTFAPCAAFLPYTVTTTFTPTARGRHRLLVTNVDGELLGETLLDARAPDDHSSAFNITGMWYDPASNGSGLTFIHSRLNDNAVFGTWYLYDSGGSARWYSIQNAQWKSQGRVLEGLLYSTSAIASCPTAFPGCPAQVGIASVVGRARVTIIDAGRMRVEALSSDGAVIFASDTVRAEI
jgi:hypothetical protein